MGEQFLEDLVGLADYFRKSSTGKNLLLNNIKVTDIELCTDNTSLYKKYYIHSVFYKDLNVSEMGSLSAEVYVYADLKFLTSFDSSINENNSIKVSIESDDSDILSHIDETFLKFSLTNKNWVLESLKYDLSGIDKSLFNRIYISKPNSHSISKIIKRSGLCGFSQSLCKLDRPLDMEYFLYYYRNTNGVNHKETYFEFKVDKLSKKEISDICLHLESCHQEKRENREISIGSLSSNVGDTIYKLFNYFDIVKVNGKEVINVICQVE